MLGPGLEEVQLYDQVHRLLRCHEALLGDGGRNRPFYRALQRTVRSDSTVLDIGTGTGIWAIVAARLGARRVVAVEMEPLLIEIIRELARINGVADRVEVVLGDSRQLNLAREFDVVFTETIGHVGFDEQIVSITNDARQRFLKPGGILIPETVSLLAAAVSFPKGRNKLPVKVPLDYGYFESLAQNSPVPAAKPTRYTRRTPPQVLIHADLNQLSGPLDLSGLTASWPDVAVDGVDGFVVWCESTLTPGIHLSTLATTSWSPMIYRIRPFENPRGRLEFCLSLGSATSRWTASLDSAGGLESRSYSPALVAAELMARARAGMSILEHNRRLGIH